MVIIILKSINIILQIILVWMNVASYLEDKNKINLAAAILWSIALIFNIIDLIVKLID